MKKHQRKMVACEQRKALAQLATACSGAVDLSGEEPRLVGRSEPVAIALGACAITHAPVDSELLSALNKLKIG